LTRRLQILTSIVISILTLLFVLQKVDLREVTRTFISTNYPYLVLAGLCSMLAFFLAAVRWRYLLLPLQAIRLKMLFSTLMVGFFSNYLLPAKAGELVRLFVLGRRTGLSESAILATIVLERAIDVFILTVALLGVLLILPLPDWMSYVGEVAGVMLVGVFVVLVVLLCRSQHVIGLATRVLNPISTRLARRITARLEAFTKGLEVLRRSSNLGWALFFSLLDWVASAGVQYLVGLALGVRTHWIAYVLLVALFNLIAIIPSLPGRIGTWELVSIGALALFGIDSGRAVAFPTLLRVSHLMPLALGYFYFSREGLHLLEIYGGREATTLSQGEQS